MWRKTVGLCALLLLLSACKQEEVAVGKLPPIGGL